MAQEPIGALIRCARLEGGRTGPREATRGAPVNHVDKRFGERDRLIRFGDAQVRSSKVAKEPLYETDQL